jgi:serine/threonine protein kinase
VDGKRIQAAKKIVRQNAPDFDRNNPNALNRALASERRFLSRIHCANVIGIITYKATGYNRGLYLEYAPNGDLRNWLSRDNCDPLEGYFFKGLTAGLASIHAAGIVHRDMKLDNVLVFADEQLVKICDLGLARKESLLIKYPQFEVGTDMYMAPEVWNPDRVPQTKAVDIYALGRMLWEMLTLTFLTQIPNPDMSKLAETVKTSFAQRLHAIVPQMIELDSSKRPTITEICAITDKLDGQPTSTDALAPGS